MKRLPADFFPKGAIGHQILLGAPQPDASWLTIVGVVGDVQDVALRNDPMPQFYTPVAQEGSGAILRRNPHCARSRRDHSFRPTGCAWHRPGVAWVYDVVTMDDRIAKAIGRPRFETVLLAFFAASALFLAAIGIFGVVAHSTAQRTQEIGIRMALGANGSRVVRIVLYDGLRPVLLGVLLGLCGALTMSRIFSSLLFDVKATDPAIFLTASIILTAVAIAACLIPARRATQVDPMVALRSE